MTTDSRRKYPKKWGKEKTKVRYGPKSGKTSDEYCDISFKDAKLAGSSFQKLKLNGFDFSGADLRGVSFHKAELKNIEFSKADLRGASFHEAKLEKVEIDGALTGITTSQQVRLFLLSCIVSLLSNLATAYSIGLSLVTFLLPLGLIHTAKEDYSVNAIELLILIAFPFLFFLTTIFSYFVGMDSCFPASFLTATILSVVVVAAIPNDNTDFATLLLSGIVSFVIVSLGTFIQSQVIYLIREISYLNNSIEEDNSIEEGLGLQSISIYATSFIGILLGICAFVLPDYHSWAEKIDILIIYLLATIFVSCIGILFGFRAFKEKEDYHDFSGTAPYEISIPQTLKDDFNERDKKSGLEISSQEVNSNNNNGKITLESVVKDLEKQITKFVDKTVEERTNQRKFKFAIVRFLVDLLLNLFKTNFSKSRIVDATFGDTNLHRTNFSPAIVNFSPSIDFDLDKTTLLERFEILLTEQLIPVRQAILEGPPTVIKIDSIINVVNNIIDSMIKGGSIGSISMQAGPSETSQIESVPKQDDKGSSGMPSEDKINVTSTTTVSGNSTVSGNARVGTVEFYNGYTNRGVDPEDLFSLIGVISKKSKVFPEHHQREAADINLDNLKDELEKEVDKQDPKKVNYYLKGLTAAAASALVSFGVASGEIAKIVTNVSDVLGSTRTITEEVQRIQKNPVEFQSLTASEDQLVAIGIFAEKLGNVAEEVKKLSGQ